MTEQDPSEFDAQAEYLDESALLPMQEFTTTMKQGYLEDEVDIWREEAYNHVRELVNRYNKLAYKAGMAVEAAEERANEAERKLAELEARVAESENAAETATVESYSSDADDDLTYDTTDYADDADDAATEDYSEYTEEPEQEFAPVEVEDEEPAVDETVFEEASVEEAPVAPVAPVASPTVYASERAEKILAAAAEAAAEHVSTALAKVAKIETEAQEEAEELVATATAEAAEILANATEEANNLKANAVTDAADALENLNKVKADHTALVNRIILFHQTSLDQSQDLLGTVTQEDVAGEVESNDETEPAETDFSEDDLASIDGDVEAEDHEEETAHEGGSSEELEEPEVDSHDLATDEDDNEKYRY